ncbi:hypothetical protein [Poseidonibacter ostreae]|uniref:Uncharacterized protein n=1 Tax=Poseidonibacter ostreae TaxID=2654171 RepID=A0A6L4WW57_9BACT|nr:hypothetical protein [Poseidonibacter ostreae]KAB7891266.1 hypothetical protein GBG19_00085 [Poseidonibacter ostreae]
MISLIVKLINKIFGSKIKKIKHQLRRKYPILFPATRKYSNYRRKHTFSDGQIIFYTLSMTMSTLVIIGVALYGGRLFISQNMFTLVSVPFFIVIFYEISQRVVNVRKLDILRRKKRQNSKKVDNVFVSDFNEEIDLSKDSVIIRSIEFKVSSYFDFEHEAKLQALDNKCNAVINTKISEGYFKGYVVRRAIEE